jgi:hypothetical protein
MKCLIGTTQIKKNIEKLEIRKKKFSIQIVMRNINNRLKILIQ